MIGIGNSALSAFAAPWRTSRRIIGFGFFKRQVFCGSVFAEATTRQDGGQVPDAGLLDW